MEESINQSIDRSHFVLFTISSRTLYITCNACRQNTLNHRNEKSKSPQYKSMWSLSKFNSLYVHFTLLKFIVKSFKCNKNAIKLGFVIDHSAYCDPFIVFLSNTWRRRHISVYNGLIALGKSLLLQKQVSDTTEILQQFLTHTTVKVTVAR